MLLYTVFFLILSCTQTIGSRMRIENNAYKGMLIALPENAEEEERPRIVQSVENMLKSSSVLLQMSTKGRAYISEVSLLIPDNWDIPYDDQRWKSTSFNSSTFADPRAALTIDEADVVVTDKGQNPYVLHQAGCGRRGLRIILQKDFLLRYENTGVEFARLWSEYRYGVFPEGGFKNDEKYPLTYRSPNENEDKVTGCSDKTFWSSSLCNEDDKQCVLNSMTSSMMDQHLPSASLFCEGSVSLGPKHNTESPSKHNLLCKEEGTLFTVMRSPDFAYGKNAAPKYLQHATDVTFRFVREAVSPKVIVAIDVSSRMAQEKRFILAQAAFYHFIYSTLPYGSEVTLYVFGDEDGTKLVKDAVILKSEDSRILYVESQPLPEEPSDTKNFSLSQLFDEIFMPKGDTADTKTESSTIIIVTTESRVDASTYTKVKQKISDTESQLHIMLFAEGTEDESSNDSSLQDLCSETGGEVISLQTDALRDLYRGFSKSIGNFNKEIQVTYDYLNEECDEDLEVSFTIDESLTENLKVFLFFPYSEISHLHYKKTILQTPSGNVLSFMKLEFLFAWAIDLTKPEAGEYVLKTRRVEDVTYPVLISVTGTTPASEDPITVNLWAETLTGVQTEPRPVQIYAEITKGSNPIRSADVMATVYHPDGKISELMLLDDGLGDVDITKNDGIYGRYFTNFTAPGSYNLHVKAFQGNMTEVVIGPGDFCCGSFFPAVTQHSTGNFQREAGPFTFHVPYFKDSVNRDKYAPSQITDLRLYSRYDRICVLHWTAVGDDYDAGSAHIYELKVFREAAIIRNRFSDREQEIFSETIESPQEATYGTSLNHAFELPVSIAGGMYYIAIRAIDDVGNAGEPSNAVPVWVGESSPRIIDCRSEEDKCDGECKESPFAEKLHGNSANINIPDTLTLTSIPIYIFMISLIL